MMSVISVLPNLTNSTNRKITVAAFYSRLDSKFPDLLALADSLASQGDYSLKANLMRIDKSEFIDLDDVRLRPGLTATNLFSESELDEIFKDGQADETPEIFKK